MKKPVDKSFKPDSLFTLLDKKGNVVFEIRKNGSLYVYEKQPKNEGFATLLDKYWEIYPEHDQMFRILESVYMHGYHNGHINGMKGI